MLAFLLWKMRVIALCVSDNEVCVFLNVHVCSMTGQTEINKAAPCSQFNVRVVEGRAAAQVGSYSYKQEYITPQECATLHMGSPTAKTHITCLKYVRTTYK